MPPIPAAVIPSPIRLARAGDLPGMLSLYRHLNPVDPTPPAELTQRTWGAMLASGMMRILLAERDGMPVASATLIVIPNLTAGTKPYALIENVVTHADFRRLGLGQAVLAAALQRAWAEGCYKVSLATGSSQESTLRFYETAGFRRNAKTFFEIRPA